MPRLDTPSHVTWKLSCFSKCSRAFKTAWCSALSEITWPPRDIEHLASPSMARLHDSVPPLVKINSWLLVPRSLRVYRAHHRWPRVPRVPPHVHSMDFQNVDRGTGASPGVLDRKAA